MTSVAVVSPWLIFGLARECIVYNNILSRISQTWWSSVGLILQ